LPKYFAPTAANATKIMTYSTAEPTTYLKPPAFPVAVGTSCTAKPEGCAAVASDWGKTNPAPLNKGAYPIGGFTFIDLYTCYNLASDVDALVGTTANNLGLWRWYFGSAAENTGLPGKSLGKNQFAKVPATYITAIKKLLTTFAPTKVAVAGSGGTCSVAGGA